MNHYLSSQCCTEMHLVLIFVNNGYQQNIKMNEEIWLRQENTHTHHHTHHHTHTHTITHTWNNSVAATLKPRPSPHYKGACVYKLVRLLPPCFIWHWSLNKKNQSPIPFNV